MSLFGLRGLTWDTIDKKYWVITVDQFGRCSCHADVPRYATAANKWVSDTRCELGLVSTHQDISPTSHYEIRPGLDAPMGFPQVISPDRNNQPHSLPILEAPKAAPAQPTVTPGTIPGTNMSKVFAKRNDNTDPTVLMDQPAKPIEAPAVIATPTEEIKLYTPTLPPLKTEAPPVFMSSPETVYTAMTHMLHALDEARAEDPDWGVVDHHVDAAKKILGDKWAKKIKG